MKHQNRRRALSFGDDADQYDRARPRYPTALVDDLTLDEPVRVLDVGCGSGIAGRQLLARGCEVLGVEPDARMAAVARRSGLDVELATFEEWDPAGRAFDLVASGQAWHWVDPEVGPPKAAGVLEPGGRLSAFWNWGRPDPDAKTAFIEVYTAHAPDLVENSDALGTLEDTDSAETVAAIGESGMFETPEVRNYRWDQAYAAEAWLDKLATHGDHRLLPPEQLAPLLDAVGAAVDGLGGTITIHYMTRLVTARRRD